MKTFLAAGVGILLAALPLAGIANEANGNPAIQDFLEGTLLNIINITIRFLIAVATLIFIATMVYYISAGGDAEKTKEARRFIIFALVGLVLIITVWGIVNVIVNSLYLNPNPPKPPQFQ